MRTPFIHAMACARVSTPETYAERITMFTVKSTAASTLPAMLRMRVPSRRSVSS
ncbi:MAG: hypothetical protein M5U28_44455 [Sandaracinaceae bacterium]|nr:hypothetical protein [Sandaracinaceae bacterium]